MYDKMNDAAKDYEELLESLISIFKNLEEVRPPGVLNITHFSLLTYNIHFCLKYTNHSLSASQDRAQDRPSEARN